MNLIRRKMRSASHYPILITIFCIGVAATLIGLGSSGALDNLTRSPTTIVQTGDPTTSPIVLTSAPTNTPTTSKPTKSPTRLPSKSPSIEPSEAPSTGPTDTPSKSPITSLPSNSPSKSPSKSPTTSKPSVSPSTSPSTSPTTSKPSGSPTILPSMSPTQPGDTLPPSASPTKLPSTSPSRTPSNSPSKSPTTSSPSVSPIISPTKSPTTSTPSGNPTTSQFPTKSPTLPQHAHFRTGSTSQSLTADGYTTLALYWNTLVFQKSISFDTGEYVAASASSQFHVACATVVLATELNWVGGYMSRSINAGIDSVKYGSVFMYVGSTTNKPAFTLCSIFPLDGTFGENIKASAYRESAGNTATTPLGSYSIVNIGDPSNNMKVLGTVAQSITLNTYVLLNSYWGSVSYENGAISFSGGIATIDTAGIYLMSATFRISPVSTWYGTYVQRAGTSDSTLYGYQYTYVGDTGNDIAITIPALVQVNDGDTIGIYLRRPDTANMDINPNGVWTIVGLGSTIDYMFRKGGGDQTLTTNTLTLLNEYWDTAVSSSGISFSNGIATVTLSGYYYVVATIGFEVESAWLGGYIARSGVSTQFGYRYINVGNTDSVPNLAISALLRCDGGDTISVYAIKTTAGGVDPTIPGTFFIARLPS